LGELQHGKTVKVDGKRDSPKRCCRIASARAQDRLRVDTRPTESVKRLAKGADLLMHDGGFAEERRPKAQEYYHSTAREAAQLAKVAKVKTSSGCSYQRCDQRRFCIAKRGSEDLQTDARPERFPDTVIETAKVESYGVLNS